MDIAALNLGINSDAVKGANVELRDFAKTAGTAESAADKFRNTVENAANSNEMLSKRTQSLIRQVEFERAQLQRTSAEQERYNALKRAGVGASSAAGQAVSVAIARLQEERAAAAAAAAASKGHADSTTVVGSAAAGLVEHLKALALTYISVEAARKLWETGLKAGDLGEQAEQIGINTDQLQAYRLAGAQAGIEVEAMDGAITKLAKAMGSAADGNKESIEFFQRLGVKLLDAKGQLIPVADALPSVAKGILNVGSSSQRTADLMTAFGKSGAKMATVLGDMAGGNDALIASARQQNAIISPGAIAAWDALGDRMKVTQQKWATLIGEFGADYALPVIDKLNNMLDSTKKELEAIASLWKWIMSNMDAAKTASILSTAAPAQADVKNLQDRLDALRQNPTQFGFKSSEKALTDQMAALQEASNRAQDIAKQAAMQNDEANARRGTLPISAPPLGVNDNLGSKGVGDPKVKGAGDAEAKAYQKIIDSAKDYIATKNAETAAIGLSVEAAARLKHETELTAKATNDNTKLTAAQVAQIKALAQSMAEADAKFAGAKFMDEATTKSAEFVASQQIERDTLWMSAEAADAYRISQGYLNDAKSKGIELLDTEKDRLRGLAATQAAESEKTRQAKFYNDLAKDSFTGFITDLKQGIQDGKSFWDSFGNAGLNALNTISNKLLEMAAQKLFEAAFSGGSGGAGGSGGIGGVIGNLLGTAIGSIFGGGGGLGGGSGWTYAKGGAFDRGRELAFANGAAFDHGNVVRFAGGGIVSSPTNFAMAGGGRGLMGEAGPEGILPLHRGRDGGLGVRVSGMGGQAISGTLNVNVNLNNEMLSAQIDNQSNANIAVATPKILGQSEKRATKIAPRAVANDKATRTTDWRMSNG